MGNTTALLAGLGAGIVLSTLLFLIRRHAWEVARTLGWAALAAVGLAVIGGILMVVASSGKGGDAGMAAALFVIFGTLGIGAALVAAGGLGAVQGKVLGRPLPEAFLTGLLDPILAVIVVWCFLSLIVAPMSRARTDDWWGQELARRKQMEDLEKAIPAKYRKIPSQAIDEHNRLRKGIEARGMEAPRLVPEDVEMKIRNLEIARSRPPVPAVLTDYQLIEDKKRGGMIGLAIGWLVGALVVPLAWRRH